METVLIALWAQDLQRTFSVDLSGVILWAILKTSIGPGELAGCQGFPQVCARSEKRAWTVLYYQACLRPGLSHTLVEVF